VSALPAAEGLLVLAQELGELGEPGGAGPLTAPQIEFGQLLPMLIVFGVAVLGVLVEAFAPHAARYRVQLALALAGLVAAFVAVVLLAETRSIAAEGSVAVDGPALFLQGTILLLSVLGVLTIGERSLDTGGDAFAAQASSLPGSTQERTLTRAGITQTEVFPLTMFTVGGMLLFPAANDLLVMFVALEILSLPLYLLCAMARRKRLLSQEAALKYFLLGSFSSGFLLYGIALLYGYAGTLELAGIADAVSTQAGNDTLLLLGTALVGVGLLFKVGAAPFHSWTPDAYQGAPTPVTGFMAACTKVAAFGALMRVFYVALGGVGWDWKPMLWIVAALTMVVGSVVALTQTDVKRMLAYSSVAHAGFILTGVVALNESGTAAVLFYLLAYGFTTIGAFAVVTLVRDAGGEATHLSQWAGLGKRSPLVGGVFALFLLAFAGIPLTSGFTGKFAVFGAAIEGGAAVLVVIGVVTSAIAAFFYARVIVLMFFSEPAAEGPTVAVPSVLTTVAVAVGAAVTVLLGVAPQAVLDLADQAAVFVR
jgi:NADH-quinone oxidoreductase subunit N